MRNKQTLNLGGIICVAAAIYCLYYILLLDNLVPFSISCFFRNMNHCMNRYHAISVGLLPIYISLMVFGTTIIGLYFGSKLQRWIIQFLNTNNFSTSSKIVATNLVRKKP